MFFPFLRPSLSIADTFPVSSVAGLSSFLRAYAAMMTVMSIFCERGFGYNTLCSCTKLCLPSCPFTVKRGVLWPPLVFPLVLFLSCFSTQMGQRDIIVWLISEYPPPRRKKKGLHKLDESMRFRSQMMLILCTVWERS